MILPVYSEENFRTMNWAWKKYGEHCTVEVNENSFSTQNLEALKEFLKDMNENGCRIFLLNMSQLNKICGKKLGIIINLYSFAETNNFEIKLYKLQPYVSQIIFQTGLNRIFDICDPNQEVDFWLYDTETAISA
jgi:anti-anti-sigma factor